MNHRHAPRSVADYLDQLRNCLQGEDPALIQDAAYDAEEYLRAELAANKDKSEADVLELIASTYGAPDEVAAAYRDTEVKLRAAMRPAVRPAAAKPRGPVARFFGVFSDQRAYLALFFMFLSFATGIVYFTISVVGMSLSVGLAVLIIGVPFFLTFVALTRIMSLVEGRIVEGLLGERMPRRPMHPGSPASFGQRIGDMLTDRRTWSTLAYFLLMLPLGICYFVVALVGLTVGTVFTVGPLVEVANKLGLTSGEFHVATDFETHVNPDWLGQLAGSWLGLLALMALGILLVTLTLHAARLIGLAHGRFAKAMLVARASS